MFEPTDLPTYRALLTVPIEQVLDDRRALYERLTDVEFLAILGNQIHDFCEVKQINPVEFMLLLSKALVLTAMQELGVLPDDDDDEDE